MKRIPLIKRILPSYTRGEELTNMITHIVGGALAAAALVLCVVFAALHGNVWGVVSGAVYGASMILLYTMSSLYHGLPPKGMAKRVFQVIDHCSIFLLIAGTYTPVTLCGVRPHNPALAWTLFGVVWGLAVLGIVLNAIDLRQVRTVSMILYLGMGWCIVLAAPTVLQQTEPGAVWLLVSGGIAYTVGAAFYGAGKKHRYVHSVFHIFVVVGSILQFLCILLYWM